MLSVTCHHGNCHTCSRLHLMLTVQREITKTGKQIQLLAIHSDLNMCYCMSMLVPKFTKNTSVMNISIFFFILGNHSFHIHHFKYYQYYESKVVSIVHCRALDNYFVAWLFQRFSFYSISFKYLLLNMSSLHVRYYKGLKVGKKKINE